MSKKNSKNANNSITNTVDDLNTPAQTILKEETPMTTTSTPEPVENTTPLISEPPVKTRVQRAEKPIWIRPDDPRFADATALADAPVKPRGIKPQGFEGMRVLMVPFDTKAAKPARQAAAPRKQKAARKPSDLQIRNLGVTGRRAELFNRLQALEVETNEVKAELITLLQ